MKVIKFSLVLTLCLFGFEAYAVDIPTSSRAEKSIASVEPRLTKELASKGLEYGSPIFIRIFKKSSTLELWVESNDGTYKHFKNYRICRFSGNLGPKTKQGDYQSPEGFYYVGANSFNPWSKYHLSFNLGYPNKYDRHHGRTGSALMVHGECVSIGCFAMTDPNINEIYALSVAAVKSGQPFIRVHSFPFKLSLNNLSDSVINPWYPFWMNLKEGYDYFVENKRPPNVEVSNGKYIFSE